MSDHVRPYLHTLSKDKRAKRGFENLQRILQHRGVSGSQITNAERLRKPDFSCRMDCAAASHDYSQVLWAFTHVKTVPPHPL